MLTSRRRRAAHADDRSVRKRRRTGGAQPRATFSLSPGRLSGAGRRARHAAVMKYGWRSRAVINVAKSPSRRRRPLDDVLSSYIGIILPSCCSSCGDSSCWIQYTTTTFQRRLSAAASSLRWCLLMFIRGRLLEMARRRCKIVVVFSRLMSTIVCATFHQPSCGWQVSFTKDNLCHRHVCINLIS